MLHHWHLFYQIPYAVEVYRHLGFNETDIEQTVNGIRFTPMRFLGDKK